jgi:secreted PhoX family phosphatase
MGALAGCNSDSDSVAAAPSTPTATPLGFTAVSKSIADVVSVPAGYSYSVLCALGDPLRAATSAYGNLGTDDRLRKPFRRPFRRHGVLWPVRHRLAAMTPAAMIVR